MSRLRLDPGDQLNLILRTAGLGDLSLMAGAFVAIIRRIRFRLCAAVEKRGAGRSKNVALREA